LRNGEGDGNMKWISVPVYRIEELIHILEAIELRDSVMDDNLKALKKLIKAE
jgi:hypothetical protein